MLQANDQPTAVLQSRANAVIAFFRDDITVEVIFFGESQDVTGTTGEQTAVHAFDLETY